MIALFFFHRRRFVAAAVFLLLMNRHFTASCVHSCYLPRDAETSRLTPAPKSKEWRVSQAVFTDSIDAAVSTGKTPIILLREG